VEVHRPALAMKGDATAGAAVFQRLCTSCHRLANQGYDVGPDLATLADKSPEALLVAILDPDRAFEAKYGAFSIATRDGRVVAGLVSSESANGVTLRRQEAKEETFLRSEIEEVAASGHSFMPEGLEKDLKPRDLADLFAYLAASDAPAKSFPGNRPRIVKAGVDRSIVLSAADAEIRGESLIFESRYGNLGYWTSASDRASWSFEVERPGRYAVWVDHARPGQSTEDRLEILEGTQSLRYAIRGTGSWDVYRADVAGILELAAGTHRLVARPIGPLHDALIDLKSIELRPVEPFGR
ncbi:c-type cytochrome, partial [Singulisphaera rosea]